MLTRIVIAGLFTAAAVTAGAQDTGRQYFTPPGAMGATAPFSEAIQAGDTLYVAGHIGLDPKTQKAVEGTEPEAHAVLDAVKQTIESAGLHMDDLVSVTVYCTDLSLYDAFNTVYKTYFHGHYPTRAFIGVASLVRGAHFEVSGIATKPKSP
jgi:2-iminobutanoate/2-iminopropanoate deaminase